MHSHNIQRRALVTGGAGFIGSHLIDRLLAEGCRVTCLDDISSGHKVNLQQHAGNPSFVFVEADVCTPIEGEFDEVWNLASPASPVQYQSDPVKTTRTAVLGALNTLDVAHRCNAKILQASTSEIYGDPEIPVQHEAYWGHVNPVGMRACYDEGKRCAETLFFDYYRQYGTQIRVARIFNTYGPRMLENDGRVVSNFIVQALAGKNITVFGDGSQTRAFCYVDDMVDGLIALMRNENNSPGPINLGNPSEIRIDVLAERIIQATGSRSRIEYKPLPDDDPKRRCPDIAKARALLDWDPRIELEDGLKRTISYFQQALIT